MCFVGCFLSGISSAVLQCYKKMLTSVHYRVQGLQHYQLEVGEFLVRELTTIKIII